MNIRVCFYTNRHAASSRVPLFFLKVCRFSTRN